LMPSLSTFMPLVEADKSDFQSWLKNLQATTVSILKASVSDSPRPEIRVVKDCIDLSHNEDEESLTKLAGSISTIRHDSSSALSAQQLNSLHLSSSQVQPEIPPVFQNMVTTFSLNVMKKTLPVIPYENDGRLLNMSYQTLATAIHLSQAKNDSNFDDPVLELSSREYTTLKSLAISNFCLPFVANRGSEELDILELDIFKSLRGNALLLSLQVPPSSISAPPDVFNVDPFGALVFLLTSFPSVDYSLLPSTTHAPDAAAAAERTYPVGKHDHHLIRFCFVLQLVRVLVSFHPDRDVTMSGDGQEDRALLRLFRQVSEVSGAADWKQQAGCPSEDDSCSLTYVQAVKAKLLRFLRCSALFVHLYTDVPLPKAAAAIGGETNPDKVYASLCTYLGLPTSLWKLTCDPGFSEVVDTYLMQLPAHLKRAFVSPYPPQRRRLISLKKNYIQVLNMADGFQCPKTNEESRAPALCLVCGTLICCLTKCCEEQIQTTSGANNVGGCTVHAQLCSGGTGIFLYIRKCIIILSCDVTKGAYLAAPYVDEFGETDEGMKRGFPLTLDKSLMDELNNMWMNNDIPDKISRKYENEFRALIRGWWEH